MERVVVALPQQHDIGSLRPAKQLLDAPICLRHAPRRVLVHHLLAEPDPVEIGPAPYVLALEVKAQKRRFITDVQGIVGNRIAFDARLSGMMTEERSY